MIANTKGGLSTETHAVTDANSSPLGFFMTAGRVSDYIGAVALLGDLPEAQYRLGDRGYDVDWFRGALRRKDIYWYCQIDGAVYADAAVSPATRFGSFPNFLAFALRFQGKRVSCSLEGDPTPLL